VPLDGKEERLARILERLDDPVRRMRRDRKAVGDAAAGLVVVGVHGGPRLAEDLGKPRAAADLHVVPRTFLEGLLRVADRRLGLRGEVLVEVAAERDVDDLDAAADAEDGHPALARRAEECDFEPVAAGVHDVQMGMRRLAVEGGVHVVPPVRRRPSIRSM